MSNRFFLLFFAFLFIEITGCSQQPEFLSLEKDPWVMQQFKTMNMKEKIGQLIMIAVFPELDEIQKNKTLSLIQQYKPGGILIMKGSPVKTALWINDFQAASAIPLLTAMDAEWGLSFRIDSITSFPNTQSMGAVQNNDLIYKMGRDMGVQLRMLGINMNFAPVADVNKNSLNPVINNRSFGENREKVAQKALALAKGLQDANVAAVVKHFPGHGDTSSDSHNAVPVLKHPVARMDSVELYPFRYLASQGVAGIMTAHLNVPSLDPSGKPVTFSKKIITGILREKMNYRGLIVTDAMNMNSISRTDGQGEVEALAAGNDLIEFVTDLPKAILAIEKALADKILTEAEINQKCLKILALKRWLQLNSYQPANPENLTKRLNNPLFELTSRQLTEATLTVLKNYQLIPLMRLDTLKIATLSIGSWKKEPFQQMTDNYVVADHYYIDKEAPAAELEELLKQLKPYNLVIAGIQDLRVFPASSYGVTAIHREAIKRLTQQNRVISLFFGNVYAMKHFPDLEKSSALVMAYKPGKLAQELAVQLIFGATSANGKLPVTADNRFKTGMGLDINSIGRLKYTIPEETGISSALLSRKIDSLANEGIVNKAFPGCQVLVARDGKVIFHQCYGFLTYENNEAVTADHLYDFASITKVAGPLPALIKLTSEGKFDLNQTMGRYYPDFKNSNKENLKIRDVLTHQAGLPAIIPFWSKTLSKNAELREQIFTAYPVTPDAIRVSSNLYMDKKYLKPFFNEIREVPLLTQKKYLYTDIGILLLPKLIENITKQDYETYIKKAIYNRLGANTLTYNPYLHFPISRIVPTEVDDYFRKETLRGFVHDEGAALQGGVSGHAGLFGTVNDLAKLFQMYIWKGSYGGEQYFSEKTFDEFNRVQFPENGNRRALGFDKPLIDNNIKTPDEAYPISNISPESFGHSGYTGTFVWADPKTKLLYVFFSNRVYPTRNGQSFFKLKTRTRIMQAIYEAMNTGIH